MPHNPDITNTENKLPDYPVSVTYSSEVDEIVSRRPAWITRNGTMIMLLVLVLLAASSWFIDFPETVKCKGVLTAINPPQAITACSSGRLMFLNASENQPIIKGQILGALEATGDWQSVVALECFCLINKQYLDSAATENINIDASNIDITELGELQNDYQIFMAAVLKFREYIGSGIALKKIALLKADLERLKANLELQCEQKVILSKDLALTKTTFDANEKLLKDKVISQQEYRELTSKLLSKQITIPQIESSIIASRTQIADKEKAIIELLSEINTQKSLFMSALQTIISRCCDWKAKYLFAAPVSGKVHFSHNTMVGQQIQIGATVLYISPPDSRYVVSVSIPQANFGRVKAGQVTLLKLPSYPWQEYGSLTGRLSLIADVPFDSSGYSARIDLPHGLRTKTAKLIPFREGLMADVEIITKEQNLLLKMYNSITRR